MIFLQGLIPGLKVLQKSKGALKLYLLERPCYGHSMPPDGEIVKYPFCGAGHTPRDSKAQAEAQQKKICRGRQISSRK